MFSLVGDYMIPASRDEISACTARIDFTLRLRGEFKFYPEKEGQICTCLYLFAFFVCFPL